MEQSWEHSPREDCGKYGSKLKRHENTFLTQVSTLRFNGRRIELHGDNSYTSPHIPSEKITIHDLPRNVSNEEIMYFLDTNHPHVVPCSNVILGRIPSRDNRHLSAFYNGGRIVYVKGGGLPPSTPHISDYIGACM